MNNIEGKVIAIIARAVMIPVSEVKPGAKLSALGVTSLDQVECVLAVEETFHVEIGQTDLWQLRTVQDVIDAVKNALASNETPVL
jgi:acyl carrier protein